MDSWLKALIATACIVIIAGGAWLAWGERQESVEREEIAAAWAELYTEAKVQHGDTQGVRGWCNTLRKVFGNTSDIADAQVRIDQCRLVGL